MNRGILLVTTIYLAAVADSVLAPCLAVGGVMPDFLALAATFLTFVVRGSGGVLTAAAIGGLADLNLPGRCGAGVAAFGLAAFAIRLLRPQRFRRPLAQAALTFPAVAMMSLGIALLRGLLKELEWSPTGYLVDGVGAGLYTALVGLPFFWLVDRFAHRHALTF